MKKGLVVLVLCVAVFFAYAETSADLYRALNYQKFADVTKMLDEGVKLSENDFKDYMSWGYMSKYNDYTFKIIEMGGFDLKGTTYSRTLYNALNYQNYDLANHLIDLGTVLTESDFKEYMSWGYMSKHNDYTIRVIESGGFSLIGTEYSKTIYNALNYSNLTLAEYLANKGARMNDADWAEYKKWATSSKHTSITALLSTPAPQDDSVDPNVLGTTTFNGKVVVLYKDGTYEIK